MPFVPAPTVYTFMPSADAASAAISGEILPALFLPSVSRITILLFVSVSFSLLSEELSPEPIAVPSSIIPIFILSRFRMSQP